MNARGIAGMAVVVVQGEEVIFSETFGERDPVKHLPVTMDSMFYIASCTKSYMAMAIMSLVEEGKVELDARVKKYLPRFELADAKATEALTVTAAGVSILACALIYCVDWRKPGLHD